jgi:signal transduction histidine kinase
VEVSVTGAKEQHQAIPERYSTTSPSRRQTFEYEDSLAIGLTIAKRLILAHHGKIWVEASSTGSRYAFLLPIDQG